MAVGKCFTRPLPLLRPASLHQPCHIFKLVRQRHCLQPLACFLAAGDGGRNGVVETCLVFDGVVAALAQDCRDRSQRLSLRRGGRESLEILHRLHQRRCFARKSKRAGDIAKAGVFLFAEIGCCPGDEAVERAQPLEPLAGIVHGLMAPGRLVAKAGYRLFDQFQSRAADFIVERFVRVNPEGHPPSLRGDSSWRATGWRSDGRPLPPCQARRADRGWRSRRPSLPPPRSAPCIYPRKHRLPR